jgi:glycerophosphoryl diester phosphodiesterase
MAVPLIIAHRGASAEAPENTLAAFRRAVVLQADAIELDVHLTRDGIPVVFHDDNLRRLTGKRGALSLKTWLELEPLRVLQSDEPIPSLAEVLAFTRRRIVVQIELKRGIPLEPVIAAIKKARAAHWVILASFESSLVAEAAELAPTIPRMLISDGRHSLSSIVRQLKACEAHGLSVNHRSIRKAADVAFFQTRGFPVWCWTVNNARVATRLIAWGIDGLLGDNPALLTRLI